MGVQQIITDDLTGDTITDETKPVTVKYNGKDYPLYLSSDSASAFEAMLNGEGINALAALIPAPAPAARTRKPRGSGTAGKTSHAADIREWVKSTAQGKKAAKDAGYDEAGIVTLTGTDARGNVKSALKVAYELAQKDRKPVTAPASYDTPKPGSASTPAAPAATPATTSVS